MSAIEHDPHTTRLPQSRCPYCGHRLDAASRWEEMAKPKPGDLTVCILCARVSQFDANLRHRALTTAELVAIYVANPELQENALLYQRAVHSLPER